MRNHDDDGWHGAPPINLSNVDISKLTDKERWRLEHQRMHMKHRGHETMHAEMFLIFVVTLIVAQIVLLQWKTHHFKSYQRATLLGMWLIPIGLCFKFDVIPQMWKFLTFWLIFSVVTSIVVYKASRKPLSPSTPRWVYKWFLLLHKISYAAGIIGYLVIMFTILGLNLLVMVKPKPAMDFGLLTLFYGLYFGVVSRDFAEVCSEVMAAQIGYYTPKGLPAKSLDPNMCAICGNEILARDDDESGIEKAIKLTCGHIFHEFCIRGWCIVGKKQTCPYCKERVDLQRMFPGPWERPHMMYGNLLDWIRYLVAWLPVTIGIVQAINWALGLE